MFKYYALLLACIGCVAAKPGLFAYSAPYVGPAPLAAPFVTATSSQVIARNYNGIAAAPLFAAPARYVAAPSAAILGRYAAPFAAPPFAAYRAAAPYYARYAAAPAPLAAYSAPYGAAYVL